VTLTSSTAPDVTHRWTNIEAFASEIAEARICAGFHYRFSTRVGTEMGRKIGAYVAANILQPLDVAGGKRVVGESQEKEPASAVGLEQRCPRRKPRGSDLHFTVMVIFLDTKGGLNG